MKYLSLDIETTGIDVNQDQILSIGAVMDDLQNEKPIEKCPQFYGIIKHNRISGSPYALVMNSEVIKEMTNPDSEHVGDKSFIMAQFMSWVISNFGNKSKPIVAGKNVAGFDLPFLLRDKMFEGQFSHRTIDPTPWFMRRDDNTPPDLTTCLERIGRKPSNLHNALGDAIDIVYLVREGMKINER